jgi:HK97 family phage major capsid protein
MATDFPTKDEDKKVSLRNSNYPQFDFDFAQGIKDDNPEIWKAGGNIRGNEAFNLWAKARDGEETDGVISWIKEREAWAARHFEDGGQFKGGDKAGRPSNIAGVVAQMKWGVIGTLGEQGMKDVILEAVKFLEDKEDRQVSEQVEQGLRNKVEEHNEEVGDDKRKRATYRMLLAVFERGIGAYKTNPASVRPNVSSPEQWAYARVNSFLFALRNLRFQSKNKHDTDLLPKEHPLSTKENDDRIANMDNVERHIKDVRETEDSYIIEFGKSMPEENDEESRPYHDEEEEKAHDDKERSADTDEKELTKEEIDQIAEDEYVAQGNDDVLRFYAEENLQRAFEFDRTKIDEEKRTVVIGVSSEEPVERRFGMEVLGHNEDEIDMEFMSQGRSPLLLDHDATKQIGVVEEFGIDAENKRTVAKVRFSKNQMADEVYRDVLDGIRQNISVGYQVNSMQKEEEERDGVPIYRVNSWSPLEVSAVSIPADQSRLVGFARSQEKKAQIEINPNSNKERKMENVENKAPEVNLEDMKRDFAKEAKAIIDLGVQHNKRDMANEAIANGATLAQFRGQLLETIANDKPLDLPSSVDMNETEQREYSLLKAVREAANGNVTGLEREVSDEIAQRTGKSARGFYMPTNIAFRTDQIVGTNNIGGFLKPTDHLGDQFIEALKAKLVIGQAGATVLNGLKGDVAIPKMSAEVTNVGFVAENAAPSEGNATFAQVTMSPKTMAAQLDVSRKLMMQSDPSVESVLRNDVINSFARKIDEVALEGGGSNEPSGIIASSTGNVVAIGTNGGAITYAKVVDMIEAVEVDNAILNDAAVKFVGNPKVTANLRTVSKQASGVEGNFILGEDGRILGYDYLSSTLVPSDLSKGTGSNLSALLFGDFSQLLLGFYSGVDVIVDPYTGSAAGTTRLAFFQDLDIALRHDDSFSVIKDIVT